MGGSSVAGGWVVLTPSGTPTGLLCPPTPLNNTALAVRPSFRTGQVAIEQIEDQCPRRPAGRGGRTGRVEWHLRADRPERGRPKQASDPLLREPRVRRSQDPTRGQGETDHLSADGPAARRPGG